MRFTLNDLAAAAGVERHSISRWIKQLQLKKKFKKKSIGYGFSRSEAKQLSELLDFDLNTSTEKK